MRDLVKLVCTECKNENYYTDNVINNISKTGKFPLLPYLPQYLSLPSHPN